MIFFACAFIAEMEPPEWEGYSFELARALVDAASRDPANAQMSSEEKARAMRLVPGFHWTENTVRAAGVAEIWGAAQRAMRRPGTKDIAGTKDLVRSSGAVRGGAAHMVELNSNCGPRR